MSDNEFVSFGEIGGPNELPEGGEGGGGGGGRIPFPPGEIAELPIDFQQLNPLVVEVVRLRNRMHSIETQLFTQAVRVRRRPNPAELPAEFGEGDIVVGGRIPRPEINELPAFNVAQLHQRIAGLEATIAVLAQRIEQLGG